MWSRAAVVDKSWMGGCGGRVGMWIGRWVGHGNWNLHRNWHLNQHLHRHLHLGVLLTNMVHLRRYRSSLVNRATYLFVTLFPIGWLLHCVIFCLASCLIPEIVLNPLVLFYQIFMVDIYGKLMSKQDEPGGTFLGRHMGLGRFALLIYSCVALLLNLCSVFCHLWQKVSKITSYSHSPPDLHCFALCYVFSLAFLSSSDFIAGVLTTLFRLTC